ncbi:hypothetical protein LDENG_00218440 [Lucifuga dentata]|nr:hypothetical protein LDENG_00218440 [Lucifuga dentata]
MRPQHYWTVLRVSTLVVLLLTLNVESQDSECFPVIKVRRGTVYQAWVGQLLKINCTVIFCKNSSQPPVHWNKYEKTFILIDLNKTAHIKTEWKPYQDLEGISYLVFKNVQRSDSGLYQCKSGGQIQSFSHSIEVSVYGSTELTTISWKNETNITQSQETLWLYVYPAAGIIVVVIIVIVISVLVMQGCKGNSKKEKQTENQYASIPMFEQPFSHPSLQPPPRGSPSSHPPLPSRSSEHNYNIPISRESTRRNASSRQQSEEMAGRNDDHVYVKKKEDRGRKRNMVEEKEGSPLVYAALNHQTPPGASAQPRRPAEESSEYAAIRVS